MTMPCEHTCFLDAQEALQASRRHDLVREEDGVARPRLCYFLGSRLEHLALTLVGVPFTEFTDLFAHTSLPIPTRIAFPEGMDAETRRRIEEVFFPMIRQLQELRQRREEARIAAAGGDFVQDTYFMDSLEAYAMARLGARVRLHDTAVFGQQLCYYPGPVFGGMPETMIPLTMEGFREFFHTSRLRPPQAVYFPHTMTEEERVRVAGRIEELLRQVKAARKEEHDTLLRVSPGRDPGWPGPGEPLRFLLPASRYTTVMQYASQGLAKALTGLGHEARVVMEADGRELMDSVHYLREYADFQPHVTIHVNHRNHHHLHPRVVNIIWYQDPMPELVAGKPLPWRERDAVFAINSEIAGYIRGCGLEEPSIQPPCYDHEVFRLHPDEARTPRAVFVGSAYNYVLDWAGIPHFQDVMAVLLETMEQGGVFDEALAQGLADRYGFDFHRIWPHMCHYAVRDTSVRWLCQNPTTPVAIHGRFWERDPVVAPFFKGELPHGEAVARAYNRATIALAALIKTVNSQRLAELAACGCIPLVYDARAVSDPPHWDDHCLFYKTREDLHRVLATRPQADPMAIAEAFRYDTFARRILAVIAEKGCY